MSINTYVIFDKTTGAVLRQVRCMPEDAEYQAFENEGVIEGSITGDDTYVQLPAYILKQRPEMSVTIQGDQLLNVPVGAIITVDGQDYEVTAETVDLEFEHAGTYELTITKFPFLAWSGTYEAKTQS